MPRDYENELDDKFEVRSPSSFEEEEYPALGDRPQYRRRSAQKRTENTKAPLPFRVAAWGAALVLCFVAGYVGTSFALRMLNRKDILLRENVASTRQEAQTVMANGGDNEIRLNIRKVSFTVYHPEKGSIVSEKLDLLSGIMEDDIRSVTEKILAFDPGKFPPSVKLLNAFRSGDTLFLNFPAPFLTSLTAIGGEESTLFITSVVQTMKENFSPITKVRFLVDGKVPRQGAPVDLSVPWQLPQG